MRSRTIIAIPPGATIKEQLDDRGMTQKEFALRMDMSEKHISQLINGEVRLTPAVALRLESVLGVPASYWNNLETRYREKLLQVEEENAMDSDIALSKLFPYTEMVQYNWIEKATKSIDKVWNLRRYFEVARLGIIDNLMMPGIAYAGDNNKYLAVSFDQFGKAMQPEGEVSITLPDELKSYRRRDRRGRQSDTCSGIQWNHEAGYRFNTGCCSDGK